MIEFVCTPLHVRISLRVTIVTMQFRVYFSETLFSHLWGPKKQFGTIKNCHGRASYVKLDSVV